MIGTGRDRFTVGPWQGDPKVAYLRVRGSGTDVEPAELSRFMASLVTSDYTSVVTPALHPEEAHPYFVNGFEEFDSLIVLGHNMNPIPRRPQILDESLVLRRARRRDLRQIFDLDTRAFPPQWRMDRDGLNEARRATSHVQFRTVRDTTISNHSNTGVIAYAISGRTKSTAFLQRLATDPEHNRRGAGSALVLDALNWALNHRCSSLLVNTQVTNRRALLLYESLGFVRSSTRLVVLRCSL